MLISKQAPSVLPANWKFFVEPFPHQRAAIEQSFNRNYYGLLFEPGTGKTCTLINILRLKYWKHKRVFPTLIICPKGVRGHWAREFHSHASPNVAKLVQVLDGTAKQKREQLDLDKYIYVTNYETASSPVWKDICQIDWEAIVLDESHRIKQKFSMRGKKVSRARAIVELSRKVHYRYIMTGTAVPNTLQDIYNQLSFLSPHIWEEDTYYRFEAKRFYNKNAGNHWATWPDMVPRPETIPYIKSKVESCCMIVKKREVLKDLPPLTTTIVDVELPRETRKLYNELKRELVAILPSEKELKDKIVAESVIEKVIRLQQVCNGLALTTEKKLTPLPQEKIKSLLEILDQIFAADAQVIVWTNFVATYDLIQEQIQSSFPKVSPTQIVGGQSTDEREEHIEAFKQGDSRVLISNPAAGGTGIDGLQVASYAVRYSTGWNYEHYYQSRSRIERQGAQRHQALTEKVLITKDTIEEEIWNAVQTKQSQAQMITTIRNALN